jgi:thiol-disulfide isomerase/thioredoxin
MQTTRQFSRYFQALAIITILSCHSANVFSQQKSDAGGELERALKFKPTQSDVDYDLSDGEAAKKAKVVNASTIGQVGFLVRDENERLLRRFVDTNGDKKLDMWCYYKDGLEAYRDIDANFDGKTDQYRWLGANGIRWGIDDDQDGQIDSWKQISAEETTAEVVAALRDNDVNRFRRLLLTEKDIGLLGDNQDLQKLFSTKTKKAIEAFSTLAANKTLDKSAKWLHFGGTKPSLIPAGTLGSSVDIRIHDNVAALVDNNGKNSQLAIGTLVLVGDAWRIIDAPQPIRDGAAPDVGGILSAVAIALNESGEVVEGDTSPEMNKLIESYQSLEGEYGKAIKAGSKPELAKLSASRAKVLADLSLLATGSEQASWIRQYADTVCGAFEMGEDADGLTRALDFAKSLSESSDVDPDATAYLEHRMINATFNRSVREAPEKFEGAQKTYLKDLRSFVAKHPKSEKAADALMQIALAEELDGNANSKKAEALYQQVARDFASTPLGKKATQAVWRINSVGKPLPLKATAVDGTEVDLARVKDAVILVHFWATWCDPCISEFTEVDAMLKKYSKQGFRVVGIALDNDDANLQAFLKGDKKPLPEDLAAKTAPYWPQIWEKGGFESRLAMDLGVVSLPTMFLVDKNGKIISNAMTGSGLAEALEDIYEK